MSAALADAGVLLQVLGAARMRTRADLVRVRVGHHLVVVDRPHQQPHLLDPVATLVFEALDGSGTVSALVDDLGDVLEGDHSAIESDVLALVHELVVRRLVVDAGVGSLEEEATMAELSDPLLPGWYDVMPPGVDAGPGGSHLQFRRDICVEPIEHLDWLDPFVVATGGFHVGVRTNATEVDALLRRLFAAQLVEDSEAPANISLYAGEPGEGSMRYGMHRLYEGLRRVGSSLGLPYLVACLNRRLASYSPEAGSVYLPGFMAVAGERSAALIPRFAVDVDRLRARLRRSGLSFLPGSVEVDPAEMALVVRVLSEDAEPLESAERLSPGLEGDPLPIPVGRHPIVALGLTAARPFEPGIPLSTEEAVFHATQPGITSIGLPDQERLDLLARFATAESLFTCDATPKQLAGRLAGLLGA